ncbi:MAG: hypothetical protein JRH03_14500, partial [Deltaproteobacteria bacterium]|nr:hypothetical protein [Deltaproteobacteria bacterium]
DVRDVMVSGRMLVRNGRLTAMDLDDVLSRVNALGRKIAVSVKPGNTNI